MASQLTVANILDIAASAQVLARLDLEKKPLGRGKINRLLPQLIYVEREIVLWGYEQQIDAEELRKQAGYLYDLCDKYGPLAQASIGAGGGLVNVGGTTQQEANIFPIYITEANFGGTANFFADIRLANYANVKPRMEEINRLLNDNEFSINAFGMTILLDGFDARVNQYHITIDKYSTP